MLTNAAVGPIFSLNSALMFQRVLAMTIRSLVSKSILMSKEVVFAPIILYAGAKRRTREVKVISSCFHSYPNHITIIRYGDIKKIPFYGAHGVNSGVMLMRLDMMRSLNWEAEMVQLVRQFGRKTSYGDQDLINIYFNRHPDRLLVYPCIWNYRSDHCFFGQVNDTGGK